ncbi:hypothetical protein TBLA_0D05460 [Henningerozyma blattae CBS 6284]|uniref:SIT4 phosphatase-associated protein n=1 Tax=Henningerozyma blattae (strain ATCC 34711 / CBS 6284 / DSM 70876 / NBRC 10599 / NRRL Y-10934 / UCD 77-7) TaxID=1071380 RepID=I2H3T7_HENB6|nr:hypothetical protein TBLA_0D05460 [Tetrapisispora blattae CBS 6284]CCH61039.1 hypothetical protein TBLA_0D05460 [Tetrapisispora blattae CBS 6284]
MSGAFWNFGNDYNQASVLSKLLDIAFIPIHHHHNHTNHNEDDKDLSITIESSSKDSNDTLINEDLDAANDIDATTALDEDHATHESGPINDEDFVHYNPNLDILDELLDNEDLYTELMCSNFKLLGYLKYPVILDKLIDCITEESIINFKEDIEKNSLNDDNDEDNEDERIIEDEETPEFKKARIATEILSTDIWAISNTLIENHFLLDKLWKILSDSSDISMLFSTYFMKINDRLLDMDVNSMIDYILDQSNLVDLFIKHIQNPILMDFLPKIITTDTQDSSNGVIHLLMNQNLIPKLIDCLNPHNDSGQDFSSTVTAAADFLKAIITISGGSDNEMVSIIGPNELTRQLSSSVIMENLIKNMLQGGPSLNNGISIIIELIRKNNSDYDYINLTSTTLKTHPPNDRDPIYLGHMLKLFIKYMQDFQDLLTSKTIDNLKTSFGEIEPLGFERFKICELIAELLHCSNMALMNDPDAESIVKERDYARRLYIRQKYSQQSSIDNNYNHDQDVDMQVENDLALEADNSELTPDAKLNVSSPTDHELSHQMDILKLRNSQGSSNDDLDDSETPTDKSTNTLNIQQENYENSMLDENDAPILIGDALKISLETTGILSEIIKMFFKFPWNNFLHNVVFDIIQQLLNGPLETGYNKNLLIEIFKNDDLSDLIILGDAKSLEYQVENGLGLGYQGYLNLIAEEIVKFVNYVEEMDLSIKELNIILEILANENWKNFIDTRLTIARENYNTPLGDFTEDNLPDIDRSLGEEEIKLLESDVNQHYLDVDKEDQDLEDDMEHDLISENELYEDIVEHPQQLAMEDDEYMSQEQQDEEENDEMQDNDEDRKSINTNDYDNEDNEPTRYYEYTDPSGRKTTLHLTLTDNEDELTPLTKQEHRKDEDGDEEMIDEENNIPAEEDIKMSPANIVTLKATPTDPKLSKKNIVQKDFHVSSKESGNDVTNINDNDNENANKTENENENNDSLKRSIKIDPSLDEHSSKKSNLAEFNSPTSQSILKKPQDNLETVDGVDLGTVKKGKSKKKIKKRIKITMDKCTPCVILHQQIVVSHGMIMNQHIVFMV